MKLNRLHKSLITFLIFALLLVGIRWTTSSVWLKNWLVQKVQTVLLENHIVLNIADVEGDLLYGLQLKDVELKGDDNHQNEIQLSHLSVAYNPWALLYGDIELSEVTIDSIQTTIKQDSSSALWQFFTSSEDTSSTSIPNIYLSKLKLNDAKIAFETANDSLKLQLNNLNIDLGVSLQQQQIQFVDLEKIAFDINLKNGDLHLASNVVLQTQYGNITPNLALEIAPLSNATSLISSDSLGFAKPKFIIVGLDKSNKDSTSIDLGLHFESGQSILTDIQFKHDSEHLFFDHLKVKIKDPFNLLPENNPSLHAKDLEFIAKSKYQLWPIQPFDIEHLDIKTELKLSEIKEDSTSLYIPLAQLKTNLIQDSLIANILIKDKFKNSIDLIDLKASYDTTYKSFDAFLDGAISSLDINQFLTKPDSILESNINLVYSSELNYFSTNDIFDGSFEIKSINHKDNMISNIRIDTLNIYSNFSRNDFSIDAIVQSAQSRIRINSTCGDIQEHSKHETTIRFDSLSLESFTPIAGLESNLNGDFVLEGTGLNSDSLDVDISFSMSKSKINQARIDSVIADANIQEKRLTINQFLINSDLVEGSLEADLALDNLFSKSNELNGLFRIKDVQPLAPVFGLKSLALNGEIQANIKATENDRYIFLSEYSLNDISVDSSFYALGINGSLELPMVKKPTFKAKITINEPQAPPVAFRDIQLNTQGQLLDSETTGVLDISFKNRSSGFSNIHSNYWLQNKTTSFFVNNWIIKNGDLELQLDKPFSLNIGKNFAKVDTFALVRPDAKFEASIYAFNDKFDAHFDIKNLDLGTIQTTYLKEAYVTGLFDGQVEIHKEEEISELDSRFSFKNVDSDFFKSDSLFFNTHLVDDKLDADIRIWQDGDTLASLDLNIPFRIGDPKDFPDSFYDQEVKGRLWVNTNLQKIHKAIPQLADSKLRALFKTDLKLDGTAGNPKVKGFTRLSYLRSSNPILDTLYVSFDYDHSSDQIVSSGYAYFEDQKVMEMQAKAPLRIDLQTHQYLLPNAEDSVDVKLKTDNFDLSILNAPFEKVLPGRIGGRVALDISVKGQYEKPELNGVALANKLSLRLYDNSTHYKDGKIDLRLNNNTVSVKEFEAESGTGNMNLSGSMQMKNMLPEEFDFRVKSTRFNLIDSKNIIADVSSDLKLTGSLAKPKLRGSVSIDDGKYVLQDFGEMKIEDIQLDSLEQDSTAILFEKAQENLDLELNLNIADHFLIRNALYPTIEIEGGGELNIVKAPKDSLLQVFGALETETGYAEILGKRFSLDEGQITFSGPAENPDIYIKTAYNVPQPHDVTIWYIVEGTAEEPKFSYKSQPQMELQNIISYVLFNRPYYALEGWQQTFADTDKMGTGGSTSALAFQLLASRVENLASEKLGIDVVQIENSGSGSTAATTVKTGWYINQKTFFAILNEIANAESETQFILEYLLTKKFNIIITQGGDSRTRLDVRYQKDY